MRHVALGGVALFLLATPSGVARAKHPGQAGVGFQVGFYKYHAGTAAPASYGYGYAAVPMTGYAPAYGYGMAPAPMMAPPGGCSGSGYSYGYAAPGYGYVGPGYAGPQAGVFPFPGYGGGLVETVRVIKELREALDQLRPDPKTDPGLKAELEKLRTDLKADIESVRKQVVATGIPPNLDKNLEEIKTLIQKQREDFEEVRKYLKAKDPNVPWK